MDLRDIKGQETAKRALEIAVSGGHSLLLVGSSGCGKSMLAARRQGLHPPDGNGGALSFADNPCDGLRAHKAALSLLAHGHHTQLTITARPCPCGHLGGDPGRECARAPRCATIHRARLDTLAEMVDMCCEMPSLSACDLALPPPAETSAMVAARIVAVRAIQTKRNDRGFPNSALYGQELNDLARQDTEARRLLTEATERMRLTARAHVKVLRVARTIADMDATENVRRIHIAEAIAWRRTFN
ncbi:MAG: hypothetical protein A3E78_12245 [Alphaproteobacteria bacterium RIFCSPHIGHO2_12_FULL_63_12]|nr:MAG: hypothetical protein A3E78_12245 [Alphaproteobacteria bacterium RIFCSPHIGHO2_12_FULL_63_12]